MNRRETLLGLVSAALAGSAAAQGQRLTYTLRNNKLIVPVTVNGKPAQAMIDSGSSRSGVSPALARRARVRLGGAFSYRGVQGRGRARSASGAVFDLGGVSAAPASLVVLDFEAIFAQPIDAVIGRNLFDRFAATFDFDSGEVVFGEAAAPWPGVETALFPASEGMAVDVDLGGGRMVRALVDTGADQPLILSPGPAERLKLLDGLRSSTVSLGGYSDSAVGQIASAPSVSLAGTAFRQVPFVVAARPIGVDAIVGLPLITRFNARFDYPAAKALWAVRSAFVGAPFWRDLTGLIGLARNGRISIDHVARGGPAEAAGFRKGEVIVAINGEPPPQGGQALTSGDEAVFTMADGKRRKIRVAEYY